MEKHGIDNLKKFILVFIQAGMVVEQVMEDGKVTWVEGVSAGVKLSPELMVLLNTDYALLAKEWLDLDGEENAALTAFVVEHLNLSNDVAEAFIERAFSLAIEISIVGQKIYGLFKGLKQDASA